MATTLPQVEELELVVEPEPTITIQTVPLSSPADATTTTSDSKEEAGGFVAALKLTQSLTILTDDHDTIIETAIDKTSCCLSFLLDDRSIFTKNKDNFQDRCEAVCATTSHRVKEEKRDEKLETNTLEKHEDNIKSLYDLKYEAFWEDMNRHFKKSSSGAQSSVFEITKIIESEIEKVKKVRHAIDAQKSKHSSFPMRFSSLSTPIFESVTEIKERRHRDPDELDSIENVQSMRKWLKSLKRAQTNDVYQEIDDALSFFSGNDSLKKMKQYDSEDVKSLKMSILMGNRPMTQWQWFHVVPWIEKIDRLNRFSSIFWEWQISGAELCRMDSKRLEFLIQCSHGYAPERDKLTELIDDLVYAMKKNLLLSVITYEYEAIYELIAMLATKKKNVDENSEKAEKIHELLQFLRAKHIDGPKAFWKLDVFYFNKIDNILAVLLVSNKIRKLFHQYFPGYLVDPTPQNAIQEHKNELQPEADEFIKGAFALEDVKDDEDEDIDNELKQGITDIAIDTFGDFVDGCCCSACKCGTFIKAFDRMSLRIMWLLIGALSVGCLITWFWMSRRSKTGISVVISWSAKAIAQRAIQAMEYEFFVPQMLLNVAIGGLLNGDINLMNPDNYISNPQYDEFFTQYQKYSGSQSSVYALYAYESRNQTVIGSYTSDDASVVYIFNGSCGFDYTYDDATKQRDVDSMILEGCSYSPQSRPWFTKANELSLNEMGWTEPYLFTENNQIGMSLVRRVDYNGFDVIFIAEFTTESIKSIFYTFENVIGGITYLITPDGSVIASDIGEIDCVDDDIVDCSASDTLLLDSVAVLREGDDIALDHYNNATVIDKDDFAITLYSFHSVYLHSTNVEYGSIAVVYDNEHFASIESAEISTLIVYIVSTLAVVCILCCLDRCKKMRGFSDEEILGGNADDDGQNRENKDRKCKTYCLAKFVNINIFKCSFFYALFVFIVSFMIWEQNVNPLWHHTMDIFYNEEYLIVQDKVMSIIHVAETIADIVEERFIRDDMHLSDDEIPIETDEFLANLMESFQDSEAEYSAYMVYIATPNGMIIGARQETNNDTTNTLRIALRDNSTGWKYQQYAVNSTTLKRESTEDPIFEVSEYDPRCRVWYQIALSYMFDGSLYSAFGGYTNFLEFYNTNTAARLSRECVDAIDHYSTIWNVSSADIESVDNETNVGLDRNTIYNDSKYTLVWSQYLFSSTATTGLTATKPIIDPSTGELLAVVSVDFTLNSLSNYLNNTNDDWYSWIMRGDDYEILASSDKQVTKPIEGDLSCVTISGTCYEITNLLPYKATEHPNFYINVMSQIIDQFYNTFDETDSLPINTSTSPLELDIPLDLPNALSGRLLTYPFHDTAVELNWIIVKLMNVDIIKAAEEDDTKVVTFLIMVLLYAVFRIQDRLAKVQNKFKDEVAAASDAVDEDDNETYEAHDIDDAQKYEWLKEEMEDFVEYSSFKTWYDFLNNFNAEIGNHPLRTQMATDFMAKQSNLHIDTKKHGDLTMMLYALQFEHASEGFSGRILRFIDAYVYNVFMNIIIFLHLIFIMYLPVNPKELKSEQFADPEHKMAIIATICFIVIEVIDVILIGVGRYIEFGALSVRYSKKYARLKFGQKNHKYIDEIERHSPLWLTFFGTAGWKRFIIQLLLITLIIIDTCCMISIQIGIFTYYFPIVPILLLVRSKTIREFSIQFFYAIYYAKEILISYGVLILIVSILASAVFKDILNPHQSVDTFASSIRALISSFVFVSTGENYNEIVYSAIDRTSSSNPDQFWFREIHATIGILNLFFFVFVSIVGLYFFIPIMIFKFENAFDHSRRVNDNVVSRDKLRSKINLSIAAFIWLDMTDDGAISKKEFDLLAHSSIISRGVLLDAFEYNEDEENFDARHNKRDEISLYEFVSTMINGFHLFTVGIDSKKCYGSKFQSILECNFFRRSRNRHYSLIYIIIPSILVALLRGLTDIDEFMLNHNILNVLVHIFFFLNFIDINLRWYAFGFSRYLSLIKYRNPPLVQQAIYNWSGKKGTAMHYMRSQEADTFVFRNKTLELIHYEKQWVTINLYPTRPQTLWEKRTLSVIHRAELYLIWFSFCGWCATLIAPAMLGGYYYFFIQLYLFRLFTLVAHNQRLFALIFAILPHTINILAFLLIFMFFYARIGCTIFSNSTDSVITSVYSTVSHANFNTLGSSMLTLMQLMIGEGWHEIMYLHMIATRVEHSAYFIFYIVVVTLIISNIFIGLFLSEIEDLDNQQTHDEFINQWIDTSSKESRIIAFKRRNKLFNQLNQLKQAIKTTSKQIQKIDKIFNRKTL